MGYFDTFLLSDFPLFKSVKDDYPDGNERMIIRRVRMIVASIEIADEKVG